MRGQSKPPRLAVSFTPRDRVQTATAAHRWAGILGRRSAGLPPCSVRQRRAWRQWARVQRASASTGPLGCRGPDARSPSRPVLRRGGCVPPTRHRVVRCACEATSRHSREAGEQVLPSPGAQSETAPSSAQHAAQHAVDHMGGECVETPERQMLQAIDASMGVKAGAATPAW